MQDIFTKLKNNKRSSKAFNNYTNIYFKLSIDKIGAYIELVNDKNEVLESVNYKNYSGQTREILKYIEYIKNKNLFVIDWYSTDKNKVYLSENQFLIDLFKDSNLLVDEKLKPIDFSNNISSILLNIKENDEKILSSIFFEKDNIKDLIFLSEKYILKNRTIYEIEPIGEIFNKLHLFNTEIKNNELEKFLSIFYSYFDNIKINYQDYKLDKGEAITTKPTFIIEEIDEQNCLYIRISETIQNFEPDFIESYDISKIAILNEIEKKIILSDLINQNISDNIQEINKILNKHKKDLKDLNGFHNEDNLFIIDENLAKVFIQKELSNLISKFDIFGSEKLKYYNIKTVTPKLKLSLGSGIDFFEGDAELEIEGEFISALEAINFYKKNSYIKLNDGTNAIINKSYIDKLTKILKKNKDKVKVSFFDLPLVEELIDEKIFNENFKQYKEIFLGFNELKDKKVNLPKVKADLRTYQEQGFKWLEYLYKNSLGGCLADDMGLGKTLQTITLLSSIYPNEKKSSLIIMPKSLLFNWENELKKFNPKISYYIYYADNKDLKKAQKNNLILTTYTMMRSDIKEFKELNFHYIILDESQNIKNAETQTAKAVMLLNGKHRLALSGTPIENNLGELYSLFRFLNPAMFGSMDDFNDDYLVPIQKENNKDVMHDLKRKIYPFILRRLKKDVLKELPDKVEQTLYVDMTKEQKKLYEERRSFFYNTLRQQINTNGINKSQFFIFQALTELRQIASIPESQSDNKITSPKRELLIENILEVVANGHKVLVFVNYLDAIDLIGEDLEKNGIEFLSMSGQTKDRQALVDKFQNQDKYKVFIMTLKTGGLGLNLTAADFVFIFDPWWNKSAENQAIDRAHRMGQDKTVFSYKIITKSTIEEKILSLQEKKMALFENLISSDNSSIKSFTEEDIEFILGE